MSSSIFTLEETLWDNPLVIMSLLLYR